MANEVSTEEVIDGLTNDLSDVGDVNDFSSFSDVDVSDIEAGGEESKEEIEEESGKSDESGDPEPKDEEESKELKLDDKKEDKEEEVASSDSKMLVAKVGDKVVDIDPNTVFTHKVDGKEVEITAQELLNDASGRKSWNQKFTELGEKNKEADVKINQFNSDKDQLLGKVDNFVDAINKSDPVRALESLADLSNTNPVELRQHFIALMQEQAVAYVKMTPEQQKELDNSVQSKYHENRSQYLENQLEATNEQVALTNQISGLQRKYAISDEKLVEIHDELQDKSDVSIEALENAMTSYVSQDKASNLLSQVDPSLKENAEYVTEISAFIKKNPDMSDGEVLESIKDALEGLKAKPESKQSSSAGKKLQSKINKGKPQKDTQDLSDDLDDIVDFDDVTL